MKKLKKKRLQIQRETLRDLQPPALDKVQGGCVDTSTTCIFEPPPTTC